MGRRIFAEHYAVSHIPQANEPPFTLNVTMRHNLKQNEETMPTVRGMAPARRDRLQMKNIESEEHPERVGRPSKKNESDPFNKGQLEPIKGKRHIDEAATVGVMRPRPVKYVEGGSTAGGYLATPAP